MQPGMRGAQTQRRPALAGVILTSGVELGPTAAAPVTLKSQEIQGVHESQMFFLAYGAGTLLWICLF